MQFNLSKMNLFIFDKGAWKRITFSSNDISVQKAMHHPRWYHSTLSLSEKKEEICINEYFSNNILGSEKDVTLHLISF